ncbi:glycerophosphodiester phosphodiesterase [Streptococcus gallolyticus]|nr:glycerophosphodiester phosphodiesterase [Streptococcus gallolyticus]MBY5041667.1 glycerophosphodiester phosphodiesterase [Streptococcus gallolyticus]
MTEIVAHRGSRIDRPENTLIAFEEAVRVGADGIELDVQFTKDKEVIVLHDLTVDRTTNGRGIVADFPLAELKTLDAGSWFGPEFADQTIPTLQEVLDLLQELDFHGSLNIELKTADVAYEGIEKAIHSIVTSRNWNFSVMYSSFNLRSLYKMHHLEPKAEKAYLVSKNNFLVWLGGIASFITSLHLNCNWYFKEKKKPLKHVRLWTVNDEQQMVQAFAQNVTGIITDKPAIAKALRDKDRLL